MCIFFMILLWIFHLIFFGLGAWGTILWTVIFSWLLECYTIFEDLWKCSWYLKNEWNKLGVTWSISSYYKFKVSWITWFTVPSAVCFVNFIKMEVFERKYPTFLWQYLTFLWKYLTFLQKYRDFLWKYLSFLWKYLTFLRKYLSFLRNYLTFLWK